MSDVIDTPMPSTQSLAAAPYVIITLATAKFAPSIIEAIGVVTVLAGASLLAAHGLDTLYQLAHLHFTEETTDE